MNENTKCCDVYISIYQFIMFISSFVLPPSPPDNQTYKSFDKQVLPRKVVIEQKIRNDHPNLSMNFSKFPGAISRNNDLRLRCKPRAGRCKIAATTTRPLARDSTMSKTPVKVVLRISEMPPHKHSRNVRRGVQDFSEEFIAPELCVKCRYRCVHGERRPPASKKFKGNNKYEICACHRNERGRRGNFTGERPRLRRICERAPEKIRDKRKKPRRGA